MSGTSDNDELWTTGRTAEYLRDLGISRRQVSAMLDSGELAGVRRAPRKWGKVWASSARAYRARLLVQGATPPRPAAGADLPDDGDPPP